MNDLENLDITYINGVGPARAKLLKEELGINSAKEMLLYYPYKYIDKSRIFQVREVTEHLPYVQLRGTINHLKIQGEGSRRRLTAIFSDQTGNIELVWFKGIRYIEQKIKPGQIYTIFGKASRFGEILNIAHPEIDPAETLSEGNAGMQPQYHTSEKMKRKNVNSKALQQIIQNILANPNYRPTETLPKHLLEETGFPNIEKAIKDIHFPKTVSELTNAQNRFKFEELFYLQLNLLRYAKLRQHKQGGLVFPQIGNFFNRFYHEVLPFELTNAQKRVLKEIRADVGSGRQMNRLLQGDVGSGKTLVALMSMLMAIDNGYQACMMAPTEILARQHYETIKPMAERIGLEVELLTGSTKKKDRERIHHGLTQETLHITIGTHALLEKSVAFANLGLVVIDEQHRFGVEQRSKLWQKRTIPPHVLIMTATPIPRTLAMTLYGDLDVSIIDELPPGRKPIQTLHRLDNRRGNLYQFMLQELEAGRQIYVVFPLIEESEKSDLKNLTEGYKHYSEAFSEYEVCMVHGKMKSQEKETQMKDFIEKRAQIMVATTVIEVGVNVPNASIMIIENADRFGLSQLHQLRGRVGRGADQSYCILLTKAALSNETKKRIEIMVQSNDGFEIAEADLQIRGSGDLEGIQQSGQAFNLRIANLAKDGRILQFARETASKIIEQDPLLEKEENRILSWELKKQFQRKTNFALIS